MLPWVPPILSGNLITCEPIITNVLIFCKYFFDFFTQILILYIMILVEFRILERDIMKIEKISDTQIKCTLVDSDLTSRGLQFSDLVFKREKAKTLFEDIMTEALDRFNFSAGEGPLMIEALPNNDDSVSLIFTKLPNDSSIPGDLLSSLGHNVESTKAVKTDDFANHLIGTEKYLEKEKDSTTAKKRKSNLQKIAEQSFIYSFISMDEIIATSDIFSTCFTGKSNLHLDTGNNLFILTLTQCDMAEDEFFRICNCVSEFGVLELCNEITLAFLEEHCKLIRKDDALQTISSL